VNGKALMSGINLKELEGSDMVDVFHYLFEEDMNAATAEQMEARSTIRERLYEDLYEESYKYSIKTSKNQKTYIDDLPDGFQEKDEEIVPFNPAEKPKPYVPPTKFDPESNIPFGGLIDGPLG
jgi:hypothetical protein